VDSRRRIIVAGPVEEVTATLVNDKVLFTGVSVANPDRPVTFDFQAPLGDGEGYSGLELLLMSFAGCSGTTILSLLRRMGRTVRGLEVRARGSKRSEPPLKFETISLEFTVDSEDVVGADVERAIQLAEEAFCPVWQMVKNNVVVTTGYVIEP
jgi:putative redox protein